MQLAAAHHRGIEDYICFGQPTDALIPDPEDCGAYFICDGGHGNRNYCHKGIFFNPILAQCDMEYKDCNSEASIGGSGSGTTNSWPPTIDDQVSTVVPPVASSTEQSISTDDHLDCPKTDTDGMTFLGSHEYCDRFYLCYYGKPMQFDCASGFFWSQQKQACVAPGESECRVSILLIAIFIWII